MWKHFFILGLILTVIGGYVFWSSHRKHNTSQDAQKTASNKQIASQQKQTSTPDTSPPESLPLSKAEEVNQLLQAFYPDDMDLTDADPEFKKMLEIFASPEFATFVEESGEYTTEGYYGFLASQGIPWDRDAYYREIQEDFQKHFPGETPKGVDPYMSQRLTNMITDQDMTFTEALMDFLDEKTLAWVSARFPNSYREFGDWAAGVMMTYTPPATDTPSTDTPFAVETATPILPAPDMPADARITEAISPEKSLTPGVPPAGAPADDDVLPESNIDSDAAFEAEIRALLEQTPPEAPELPSAAIFEKRLRETFSAQRFNTALQTLNRYGPEEGLRRLQKSDPEIATEFKRIIERKQEND